MNEDAKKIYEMELHEALTLKAGSSFTTIMRVPGGWIYTVLTVLRVKVVPKKDDVKESDKKKSEEVKEEKEFDEKTFVSSTFVPMTREFNQNG